MSHTLQHHQDLFRKSDFNKWTSYDVLDQWPSNDEPQLIDISPFPLSQGLEEYLTTSLNLVKR